MRKMTYSILLAALVATGASVAVSAGTDDTMNGDEHPMKGGMMMDESMMSEMRQMMKDCREMMDTMQTQKAAE
jgi:Spy/CpxP family protein refolding chaperone